MLSGREAISLREDINANQNVLLAIKSQENLVKIRIEDLKARRDELALEKKTLGDEIAVLLTRKSEIDNYTDSK